jgi:putative endonuclease
VPGAALAARPDASESVPMKKWLRGLLGQQGERRAASFLAKNGVKILARGVSNQFGEIDLVGLDGETIVFVEVRTRRSLDAGHPAESVTPEKQARLTRAALAFLKQNRLLDRRSRFDVVAILWPQGAKSPQIEHYRNAFEAAGLGHFYS